MAPTCILKWSKKHIKLFAPHFYKGNSSIHFMSSSTQKNYCHSDIVWLDMEMSGLDVNTNQILEIACVVTNKDLQIISKDLNIVIHQPFEVLSNMNKWCLDIHTKTGLIDESHSSRVTIEDAEQTMLKYLSTYVEKGKCPLAGSSVYMDRMFLYRLMPTVNDYLHYRIIDTSTIKELIKRWNSNVPLLEKKHNHRALLDVKESIEELKHYRKFIFNPCSCI